MEFLLNRLSGQVFLLQYCFLSLLFLFNPIGLLIIPILCRCLPECISGNRVTQRRLSSLPSLRWQTSCNQPHWMLIIPKSRMYFGKHFCPSESCQSNPKDASVYLCSTFSISLTLCHGPELETQIRKTEWYWQSLKKTLWGSSSMLNSEL